MKFVSLTSATLALAASTAVAQAPNSKWNLQSFKTLVAFGDSYTDESRLNYFENHNGEAPPVGWIAPEVGGYIWIQVSITSTMHDGFMNVLGFHCLFFWPFPLNILLAKSATGQGHIYRRPYMAPLRSSICGRRDLQLCRQRRSMLK